jgi:hypothetical protein
VTADPRWKASTDVVVAGTAVKAGEVFTASEDKVADAVARGMVEPVPAARMTADNCGVRPAVRVLEDATLPAYEETGEATCKELHEDGWWRYVRRWAE